MTFTKQESGARGKRLHRGVTQGQNCPSIMIAGTVCILFFPSFLTLSVVMMKHHDLDSHMERPKRTGSRE